jgi:hypothetical protein
MPRLSVFFIRTALLYLTAGFTVGGLLLFHKGAPFWPGLWQLLPLHTEFVLVGWVTQFALGVAYWAFPRFARGAARGNARWGWAAYVLLNAGILCVILSVTLPWPLGLLVGRGAEALAVGLLTVSLWPRIKPLGD